MVQINQGTALAAMALVPGWGTAATILGTASAFGGGSGPRVRIESDQYAREGVGWGVPTLPQHRRGIVQLTGRWLFRTHGPTHEVNFDAPTTPRVPGALRTFGGLPTTTAHDAIVHGHLAAEAALRGGVSRLAGSVVLIPTGVGKFTRFEVDAASDWRASCEGATGCPVTTARSFMEALVLAQSQTVEPVFRGIDLRTWDEPGGGAWQRYQEEIGLTGPSLLGGTNGSIGWAFEQWKAHSISTPHRLAWQERRALQLVEHAAELQAWSAWKQAAADAAQVEEIQEATNNAIAQAWHASGGELNMDPSDPETVSLLVQAVTAALPGLVQPATSSAPPQPADPAEAQSSGASAGDTNGNAFVRNEGATVLEVQQGKGLLIAAAAALALLIAIR